MGKEGVIVSKRSDANFMILVYLHHRAVDRTAIFPFVCQFEGPLRLSAAQRHNFLFEFQTNILKDNILHLLTSLYEPTAAHANLGTAGSFYHIRLVLELACQVQTLMKPH